MYCLLPASFLKIKEWRLCYRKSWRTGAVQFALIPRTDYTWLLAPDLLEICNFPHVRLNGVRCRVKGESNKKQTPCDYDCIDAMMCEEKEPCEG
jgi:hypothetical protein